MPLSRQAPNERNPLSNSLQTFAAICVSLRLRGASAFRKIVDRSLRRAEKIPIDAMLLQQLAERTALFARELGRARNVAARLAQ